MKTRRIRPLREWLTALVEGAARTTIGCFIVGIVFLTGVGILGLYGPKLYEETPRIIGPRVPMPTVPAATIIAGRGIYRREGCSNCHALRDPDKSSISVADTSDGSIPDLTHEGRRNASIAWQILNIRNHKGLFPGSEMENYNHLTPRELRVLASYLATRR